MLFRYIGVFSSKVCKAYADYLENIPFLNLPSSYVLLYPHLYFGIVQLLANEEMLSSSYSFSDCPATLSWFCTALEHPTCSYACPFVSCPFLPFQSLESAGKALSN